MTIKPEVSVIIPTHNRSSLVLRSVNSALKQTLQNIEVIVAIDGDEPETREALLENQDQRLKILELSQNKGASSARNQGVINARSNWIAFLDDDDEWYPEKLENQLLAANQVNRGYPIIACRLQVYASGGTYILPRRLPRDAEPVGDYLFARNSLFRGEGSIATSMLLTTKELLLKHPFQEGLKRHQEADWLLRVSAYEQIELQFVDAPLGVLHIESDGPRVSESGDWKYSLDWVQARRNLFTSRAYSAFLLTAVSSIAAREKAWLAFWVILREVMKSGRPSFVQCGLFFGMWFVPQTLRRFIRVKWLSR